jgi:hypothetical protein
VYALNYDDKVDCEEGTNGPKKAPEVIDVEVPSGTTYYDEDGNVIPNSYLKQGDDSTNTEKDQDAGLNISFGDNSDNNKVTIDQRSTFADVMKDLIPLAEKGGHALKDTAAEILN